MPDIGNMISGTSSDLVPVPGTFYMFFLMVFSLVDFGPPTFYSFLKSLKGFYRIFYSKVDAFG